MMLVVTLHSFTTRLFQFPHNTDHNCVTLLLLFTKRTNTYTYLRLPQLYQSRMILPVYLRHSALWYFRTRSDQMSHICAGLASDLYYYYYHCITIFFILTIIFTVVIIIFDIIITIIIISIIVLDLCCQSDVKI